jgi:enamine deaminase RidA (YjgF/YER057c/UK114 family)
MLPTSMLFQPSEASMKRLSINPVPWSLQFGFNQAELIEGSGRLLFCAGQVAMDEEGNPQHAEDIRAQIGLAMSNLKAVLAEADMTLSNVVRLTIYATDIDNAFANFDAITRPLDEAGVKPAQTLLGVARLALPQLRIEIEATAAA